MHTAFVILAIIASACAASFEDDIFAGNDPKDNYFRYVRTYSLSDYDAANSADSGGVSAKGDVPQPYGFRIYYPSHTKRALRTRRAGNKASETKSSTVVVSSTDDKLLDIDEALKPLELDVLEADNSTSTEASSGTSDADEVVQNNLVINDFIRFKRNAEPERSAKMLLSDGKVLDTNREPRGAVQEKWLKQPYQVQVDERDRGRSFEDADPPNAPRVHFVTQRRSESAPPLVYHSYESRDREGRSRQRDIDLDRDLDPVYYPRPARHYGPQLGGAGHDSFSPARRPEMYYRSYDRDSRDRDFRDDRDLRGRDYERDRDRDRDFERGRRYYAPAERDRDRYYEEDRPIPSIAKQKRIIYYATLPDIHQVRPQGVDRDRDRDSNFRRGYYDDRDRDHDRDRDRDPIRDNRVPPSDDRYNTQPLAVNSGGINYRFRNGNGNGSGNENPYDNRDTTGGDKSRYDEAATAKSGAYPTKVSSSDVSVRALKKNPERRVYSEVGRRYPSDGPGYHHDNGPAAYDSNHR